MVDIFVSEVMDEHHRKIEKLFNDFKSELGKKDVFEAFNNFKWELEKHLFIEEKAIFTGYSPKNPEEYKVIPYILKEHNLILEFLKEIESKLEDSDCNIDKFTEILNKHRKFEDVSLYPKLDKNLSNEVKSRIIRRIKEISF